MENNTNTTETDIFVPLTEAAKFNWKRVVVEDPVTHSFTKKGTTTTIEWTTSNVYYKGDKEEKLPIFFQFATQKTWGFNGIWNLNCPIEEQTLENIEGYQICYPLTSTETVNKPTNEEVLTKMILDKTWEITVDAMKRFCQEEIEVIENGEKIKRSKLCGPAENSFSTAEKKKNMALAMKPNYEYANTVDKKTNNKFVDKTKPQRTYIKLLCKGKGHDLKCETKVYGPGDRLVSPAKYMSTNLGYVQGETEPVIQWDSVFWGSHGTKKPYGGSNRFRVSEMNFTPQNGSSISRRRMLSPNESVVEDNDDNSDDGNDNFNFPHPNGSGQVNSADFESPDDKNVKNLLGSGVDKDSDDESSESQEGEKVPVVEISRPKPGARPNENVERSIVFVQEPVSKPKANDDDRKKALLKKKQLLNKKAAAK